MIVHTTGMNHLKIVVWLFN